MKLTLIAAIAALFALPALAHDGVHIIDPYARVIGPSGAVFFRIGNDEAVEDTLISAASPDAGMVMLMSTSAGSDGVMKMASVPDGFSVPANGERVLASAGDHVMLMSLTRSLKAGDQVTLVLTFEHAGVVSMTCPVDNVRKTPPGEGPTTFDAQSSH
jgi:copper(I)-binding protein